MGQISRKINFTPFTHINFFQPLGYLNSFGKHKKNQSMKRKTHSTWYSFNNEAFMKFMSTNEIKVELTK